MRVDARVTSVLGGVDRPVSARIDGHVPERVDGHVDDHVGAAIGGVDVDPGVDDVGPRAPVEPGVARGVAARPGVTLAGFGRTGVALDHGVAVVASIALAASALTLGERVDPADDTACAHGATEQQQERACSE
jgi:hypothetical protein